MHTLWILFALHGFLVSMCLPFLHRPSFIRSLQIAKDTPVCLQVCLSCEGELQISSKEVKIFLSFFNS